MENGAKMFVIMEKFSDGSVGTEGHVFSDQEHAYDFTKYMNARYGNKNNEKPKFYINQVEYKDDFNQDIDNMIRYYGFKNLIKYFEEEKNK